MQRKEEPGPHETRAKEDLVVVFVARLSYNVKLTRSPFIAS